MCIRDRLKDLVKSKLENKLKGESSRIAGLLVQYEELTKKSKESEKDKLDEIFGANRSEVTKPDGYQDLLSLHHELNAFRSSFPHLSFSNVESNSYLAQQKKDVRDQIADSNSTIEDRINNFLEGHRSPIPDQSNTQLVEAFEKAEAFREKATEFSDFCLLYTSPSPRDATLSRMPSSA